MHRTCMITPSLSEAVSAFQDCLKVEGEAGGGSLGLPIHCEWFISATPVLGWGKEKPSFLLVHIGGSLCAQ